MLMLVVGLYLLWTMDTIYFGWSSLLNDEYSEVGAHDCCLF